MIRAVFLLLGILMSSWTAYYAEQYVAGSPTVLSVLITVFTVFAGFLVATVAILGDPSLIPPGSWRVAEARRDGIETRLITHVWLLTFYLIAIALLFVGVVLRNIPNTIVPDILKTWIGRAYLFFGVFAFLLTFALPRSLFIFQINRVDAEIERRRRSDGIAASSDDQGT